MSNQNEIIQLAAVNNNVATAPTINELFRDIDFSGIAQAIDNIGNHSGALTIEEKEHAKEIVNQWEHDVIKRLHDKSYEMRRFLEFFEPSEGGVISNRDMFEEIGEELAKRTNTTQEYQEVVKVWKEIQELRQQRPELPEEREDRTYKQKLEEEQNYKKEKALYELKLKQKSRELYLADKKWKEALKQNKDIDDLVKRARKFVKNLDKFQQMCHDKAQLAKLNIMVSNEDVRKSLRELLNFSATI